MMPQPHRLVQRGEGEMKPLTRAFFSFFFLSLSRSRCLFRYLSVANPQATKPPLLLLVNVFMCECWHVGECAR